MKYTGCFISCEHIQGYVGDDFLGVRDQKMIINICPNLKGYGVKTA